MKLSVTSIANGLVRVAAEGEITFCDFRAEGKEPFAVLLGDRWPTQKVVVDLGGVSFLDSTAVGWFITCRRQFASGGGLLVLHSMQPRVRQVLDLLKVGRVVPLAADEAAAMKLVAPAPAAPPVEKAKPQGAGRKDPVEPAESYDVKPAAAPSKPSKPAKGRRGNKAA